ncbi:glycosyltransferase family 39 protein [Cohnella rhizosphaerae]|uniref:Glycosyltransferase family 39 protein n=1 Tax=Cohnella rhizosphaerae TaxID=1457232 RepID=A0A9X4QQX4_9BACL|nr:glycosyltransferase family 39 protein [Cohnella rhizosphaerae]MDG0808466.1 glycosyltransferase family 39 protein [Cohnella rhizosphaerae]
MIENGVYGYKSETPNAQVPPGYPLFMAAVYKLAGYTEHDPYPSIRYAQAVMSLATIAIAAYIANRLGGPIAALATSAAMAVYPPFIWANGAILTETLAAFLLLAYLALQLGALNKLTPGASMLAGAALGLAMLARSEFAVLLPCSYFLLWLIIKDTRSTAKLLLCAGLGTALALSPWVLRNVVTLHKPIIASTQVNPFAAGTYPNKNYDDGLVDRHGKTQMEVAKERLRIGFTQHTGTYVKWYTVGKLRAIYGRMFFGSGHSPMYLDFPFRQPFHVAIVLGGLALRRAAASQTSQLRMASRRLSGHDLGDAPGFRARVQIQLYGDADPHRAGRAAGRRAGRLGAEARSRRQRRGPREGGRRV